MIINYRGNELNNLKVVSFKGKNVDDPQKKTSKPGIFDRGLEDKSYIVPKGVLTLPQHKSLLDIDEKDLPTPQGVLTQPQNKKKKIQYVDIPSSAFISRIKMVDKTKVVTPNQQAKDIARAVVVNDQDFCSIKELSTRTIKGVHPNVPLRTDEFIVEDTRTKPIVPKDTSDLVFPSDSLEFDQVNALVHASETSSMIENYWGMKTGWAFDGPITLNAHDRFFNGGTGEYVDTWDNAFYSREYKSIALLSGANKREKGEVVHAARSSDTIAHETAHAKLDGLERYLADGKCFVNTAIHETFADVSAMLHSLHSDKVINIVLESTKGDLRKDNLVSKFDIQFGKKILSQEKPCLRSALNTHKHPDQYKDLSFVGAERGKLGLEPHYFSELMSGTYYDILVNVFDKNVAETKDQKNSLIKARDVIGRLLNRSILYMPSANLEFKDLAKAALKVDEVEFGGQYREILEKVFKDRNILKDSDIKAFYDQQAKVQTLQLPKETLDSSEKFAEYIKENLPKLGLDTSKTYKLDKCFIDKDGNHFIKFASDSILKVPKERNVYYDIAGKEVPVREGITLSFNKEGKLVSCLKKEINEARKSDLLDIFRIFAEYRYKPLQDSYDEIEKEIEAEKQRREEARRKKQEGQDKSTIHTQEISPLPRISGDDDIFTPEPKPLKPFIKADVEYSPDPLPVKTGEPRVLMPTYDLQKLVELTVKLFPERNLRESIDTVHRWGIEDVVNK